MDFPGSANRKGETVMSKEAKKESMPGKAKRLAIAKKEGKSELAVYLELCKKFGRKPADSAVARVVLSWDYNLTSVWSLFSRSSGFLEDGPHVRQRHAGVANLEALENVFFTHAGMLLHDGNDVLADLEHLILRQRHIFLCDLPKKRAAHNSIWNHDTKIAFTLHALNALPRHLSESGTRTHLDNLFLPAVGAGNRNNDVRLFSDSGHELLHNPIIIVAAMPSPTANLS